MIIAIIPARGGSKGVPRKNLREVNQNPLIYYAIQACKKSTLIDKVFVSSEDEEILSISRLYGVNTIIRDLKMSEDNITLDESIFKDVEKLSRKIEVEGVITVQPTSPLISSEDLDKAIGLWLENKNSTVISCTDDTHLRWSFDGENYLPCYEKRVNRQELKKELRETGAFLICSKDQVLSGTRIGEKILPVVLPKDKAIDIDDPSDFALVDYFLRRKSIWFNVRGNNDIGMGHVYRCLTLASNFPDYNIKFVVSSNDDLAFQFISKLNYKVSISDFSDMSQYKEDIPDILINDILNTSEKLISDQKLIIKKVINFEDMGEGKKYADLVINALYKSQNKEKNTLSGYKYYCTRKEFIIVSNSNSLINKKKIVITFGGSDPLNLSEKVLNALFHMKDFNFKVILGYGNKNKEKIKANFSKYKNVEVFEDIKNMAEFLKGTYLAFTSGGRTIYELATLQIPSIIIFQNERESTHMFAYETEGFNVLGLGSGSIISSVTIQERFRLMCDEKNNKIKREHLGNFNLSEGTNRVVKLIKNI